MTHYPEQLLIDTPLSVYSQGRDKVARSARDSTGMVAATAIPNEERKGNAKVIVTASFPQRDASSEISAVSGYTEWSVPPALAHTPTEKPSSTGSPIFCSYPTSSPSETSASAGSR